MTSAPAVRILIVDDEVAQMKALCVSLGSFGYEPVGCTSPGAALDELRGSSFELLLTDLTMPGMDGIALVRSALEIDPTLPCIIMTGDGTIDSAVEAMKSGALDYILKPFKLSTVLTVLARALAVRRLRLENAALERHLRDRTAELEEANQELESFSYSVAHDLRAPLRAVDGFSVMLEETAEEELTPESRRLVGLIRRGSQEMGRLIDDLLAFSRLGRQPLNRGVVDLGKLVAEIVEDQQREAGSREVEVELGALPACSGDAALLRQVFVNLLSNAWKYTRSNPRARICVDHLVLDGEGVYRVRDNGVGFDMKYADKLFVIFQRLHSKEQFEGTGVGLSLVQRIVHRHGGRIWAEAEPGKGATFYLTLSPRAGAPE